MKRVRWLPWLTGTGFLILYSYTAAPSLVALFDDTLEFQLVGPTFGIAHPTGYPLYILLSGLWSRLLFPFGNWAWRMNLFSALAAAVAIGLLTDSALRLTRPWTHTMPRTMTPRLAWAAALAAALVYGLSPIWWQQSTVAEVYSLHGCFVAAILAVVVRLNEIETHPCADPDQPVALPAGRLSVLLVLLFGFGLAHHRTTILLAPVVLLALLGRPPGWREVQRSWWLWAVTLLGPLLLYLWIPLRASMGVLDLHGSYVNSWAGLVDHVLARQYSGFFGENPLAVERSAQDWFQLWLAQTGAAGLALGLVGLAHLLLPRQRQRQTWFGVTLVLLINLLFALNYRVPDAEVFLLPVLLAFALFVASGVAILLRLMQSWPWVANGVALLCLLLLALGIDGRGEPVNRRQEWAVHDYAVALAKVDFPPGSQLLALEGEATALRYMQQAEGLGTNATPIVADDPMQRRTLLAELVAQGLPVYLTRELEGIDSQYSFTGEGPLVRVWPRGQAQTGAPAQPIDVSFAGGQLHLQGYDLTKLDQAGGPALQLSLYWQPTTPLTQTFKLSLRLQTADGSGWTWADGRAVQSDQYPLRLVAKTPAWLPGERIRDVYEIAVPAAAVGQPANLMVILYDAESLAEAGGWSAPVVW